MSKASLAAVMDSINTAYGKKTIHLGNESDLLNVPRIPTDVFSLDVETGGGIPRGRVSTIYGAESVGKSELCLRISAQAQKRCLWCTALLARCKCGVAEPMAVAWIDIEKSDDPLWRHRHGVDADLFLPVSPNHAPAAVDIMTELLLSGEFGLIVLDSVAAMIPADNIEKSAEDGMSPGSIARMMGLATRKWQAGLNKKLIHPKTKQPWPNQTSILCINQLREHIGRIPMPPGPPGGRALKHASSLSIKLSAANSDYTMVEHDDGEKSAQAQTVHFFTEKNKTYAPRRTGKYSFDFATLTVDNARQIFEYGIRFNVVEFEGKSYTFGGTKFVGRDKAFEGFSASGAIQKIESEVKGMLRDELKASYKKAGVALDLGDQDVPAPVAKKAVKGKR